ncbi:receptor-type tyrosine-protein phosphatase N2-like protein [Cricetulus griseus]|uniref:Receptor-type tyrosine-protein phosphatase N2-like protein n=1 Tax=Cricetulus griseus TaxID=10029 RepID=A0A061I5H1_CRIGR|nr:receptor-type tyrosine-protein phosphatase N2-like protein [Cricetulus griseus]
MLSCESVLLLLSTTILMCYDDKSEPPDSDVKFMVQVQPVVMLRFSLSQLSMGQPWIELSFSLLFRTLQQNADNEKWFSPESEAALAKTLRRYLPYLELLSQAPTANARPRIEHETRPAKGEDSFPGDMLTYVAHTSALTYPPATRVKYPDNLLRPLSQLQPDELSPKVDNDVDKQQLIAALGAYTAQRPPRGNDAGPRYLLHSPVRASRPFSAPAASQRWMLPPGDSKDSPSMGDDNRLSEVDDPVYDEVSRLSVQLGDLLKDHGSPLLPEAPHPEKSSRAEIKKSEQPEEVLSSEEDPAGVEHVRSRTYSKDLLGKKPDSEPQAPRLEDQFQNRAPEMWEEEQSPKLAAQGPPSGGLQLEVQPSEKEQQGYILTGNDPLSPEKGKQLMDEVAHILGVPSGFFADVRVLGPAVTFKVSANIQNMTTADVIKATALGKRKRSVGKPNQAVISEQPLCAQDGRGPIANRSLQCLCPFIEDSRATATESKVRI